MSKKSIDLMNDIDKMEEFFKRFEVDAKTDSGSAQIDINDNEGRYILSRLYFEFPGLINVPPMSSMAASISHFSIVRNTYIERLKKNSQSERSASWNLIASIVAAITGIVSVLIAFFV